MADCNDTIQGFKCIESRFNGNCTAGHVLFAKEHSVRSSHSSKPVGRTLFVLNVPQYYTKESVSRVFSEAGEVASVTFQEKPSSGQAEDEGSKFFPKKKLKGFKVAYIVYKEAKSLRKAVKMNWPKCIFSTDEAPIKTGIEKWTEDYLNDLVSLKDLQAEVDQYMTEYDKRKEEEDSSLKEKEGVADDEGWITVSKNSRNAVAPRTHTMEQKVFEKEKKKQTAKRLVNFYSFQLRQSKMEHVANLRAKFEEDKKRIATMKAARRFRPY